jgi:hypothetical protein
MKFETNIMTVRTIVIRVSPAHSQLVIEQLPLTIHRQLTLLHQLDCQSHGMLVILLNSFNG